MMTNNPLKTALWEADRHLDTLETALQDWVATPAATWVELESNPQRLRLHDQLLFRFTKLQDALGMRLVPATLAALAEPVEDWMQGPWPTQGSPNPPSLSHGLPHPQGHRHRPPPRGHPRMT